MIKLTSKGKWKKTQNWLAKAMKHDSYTPILQKYGKRGVEALRNNTPVLTGVTAESWYYDVEETEPGKFVIRWCNSNIVNEWFNVALFIQLGHGTPEGVWVEGIDYINPALAPIFNDMANKVWNEVNDPEYYTAKKINN